MRKPVVEFAHYSFKYKSQIEPTLRDINLTLYEGEKVVIVGRSGSGKSTIGHCINGLIPFSYNGEISGSLKVMREEAVSLDIFARSMNVGTVLQDLDSQFIGLTVGEDIAFSLENNSMPVKEMRKKVEKAAALVEMKEYITSSIHQLSGGQKQRVSLAGVMVSESPILLFDEPLANLDPATGKYAMELIDQIHKNYQKTVVVIEHRLEDVLYCEVDRIIVMDDGKILADMEPNELLATDILEKHHIREPLYLKAVKYAGCQVSKEMYPAYLKRLHINECKERLLTWYEQMESNPTPRLSKPILTLEDVSFCYPHSKKTIRNMSFSIHKGEMVSIIGRNGAGKSTLSKLICGFISPDSGAIFINGKDVTKETIKERALRVGMVMQNPNHMISKHMIYDEVALGLVVRGIEANEIKNRVEKTLRICGLYPYRNWPISALSFGQKKRVTIASILVMEPEIIVLDEPTAGQDLQHYTDIMDFLVELNKQGHTIVMITHDMHLMLEYTPRAIVINNGEMIGDDTAVSILTNPELIDQAHLKETSLFELAKQIGIEDPMEFISRFISYDKEVKNIGNRNANLY